MQFISNQPTDVPEGYLTGTYGRYNQAIIQGAVSGPLSETFKLRVSGIYDRDDGYLKNITPGQPDRGANNHWALRAIGQWDPSSDFSARLTLRYAQADKDRQAGIYSLALLEQLRGHLLQQRHPWFDRQRLHQSGDHPVAGRRSLEDRGHRRGLRRPQAVCRHAAAGRAAGCGRSRVDQ